MPYQRAMIDMRRSDARVTERAILPAPAEILAPPYSCGARRNLRRFPIRLPPINILAP